MNVFNSSNASTSVIFSKEARKGLFDGLNIAAEAVGCTLGPKGHTVLIHCENKMPLVTKDGVTVAKAIKLDDPIQRMGAQLLLEAASRTNDVAGDGTTTATVLTHAMVAEGLKLLAAGYSSQLLCKGIEHMTESVVKQLRLQAKQITSSAEVAQVGAISANGDAKIGALIAEAMEKVGRDGVITVDDAKGMTTTLEVVEGMQFERGYLSPYFVTNAEKMMVTYENALVLVTDKKLSGLKELIPILEAVAHSRQPLLIIADDVEGEALQGLVLNRVRGQLPVVAVKAPGYALHRDELLRDICTLTGAKLVSSSTGVALDKLTINDLGRCKKVSIDAKSTVLVGTGDTTKDIETHVAELRSQLEDVTLNVENVQKLKQRIAKLSGGVAVIKVGGVTEIEMIEKKYRIEDALNATRAATEEGIVAGGGIALMQAIHEIKGNSNPSDDIANGVGESVVLKACRAPLQRIVTNAGKSPAVVEHRLRELFEDSGGPFDADDTEVHNRFKLGYDASQDEFVDLIEAGIVDPCKVTRTALQNAASVAITFLSLDAVVVDNEKKTGDVTVE